MKFFKFFLFLFISLSVFADYTIVLNNGATLILEKKPDFTKKMISIVKKDGQKLLLKKEIIDLDATEKANLPKVEKKQATKKIDKNENKKEEQKIINESPNSNKKILVLTDKNFKRNENSKQKSNTNSKKTYESNINNEGENSDEMNSQNSSGISDREGKGEEYWTKLFQNNKLELNEAENELKQMNDKMNKMAADKLGSTDTMFIMTISETMNKLQVNIDKQKIFIQSIKDEKQKLLDKAKKSGALPGWYRDYE